MVLQRQTGRKLRTLVIWLGFCILTGVMGELVVSLMRGRAALPWIGAIVGITTGAIGAAVSHAMKIGWIRLWPDLAGYGEKRAALAAEREEFLREATSDRKTQSTTAGMRMTSSGAENG